MDTNQTKQCSKCNTTKSIDDFSIRKANKDGYQGACKECLRISSRAYREANKEATAAYIKEYNSRPEVKEQTALRLENTKEQRKETKRLYRINNADKLKADGKEYRDSHKDEAKAYKHEWHKANKERLNKKAAVYAVDNKESIQAYKKLYRLNNKDKLAEEQRVYRNSVHGRAVRKALSHKRNAIKLGVDDGTVTTSYIEELRNVQNGSCYHCGCELDYDTKYMVHLDHYIPLSKGGLHSISNIVLSCSTCNTQKSDTIPTIPLTFNIRTEC